MFAFFFLALCWETLGIIDIHGRNRDCKAICNLMYKNGVLSVPYTHFFLWLWFFSSLALGLGVLCRDYCRNESVY